MRGTGRAILALVSVMAAVLLGSGAVPTAQTTAENPPDNLPVQEKPEVGQGIERPNPGLNPANPPKTKKAPGKSLTPKQRKQEENRSLASQVQKIASQMGPSGVSEKEALRRLELERYVAPLNKKLTGELRSTFGGLYIDNKTPKFRVVVRLTEGGLEKVSLYIKNTPLDGHVEVEPADVTLEELRATQQAAKGAADLLGIKAEGGASIQEGAVNIRVTKRDDPGQAAFQEALREVNAPRPDKVKPGEVNELSQPNVKGGTDL